MSDREQEPDQRAPGAAFDDDVDPEAPATVAEVAESRRLRDALEGAGGLALEATPDAELVRSLRAAWSPDPIDEGAHAALLDDLSTAEEIALAAELRDALSFEELRPSNGSVPRAPEAKTTSTDGDFALALRAAWSPSAIDEAAHRTIVDRALGLSGPRNVVSLDTATKNRTRVVIVTSTSILALAASVIVWITTGPSGHGQEAPLARVRSTQPLFDEPFRSGETSARIDKIALARASDYRDNRFAKWGVR